MIIEEKFETKVYSDNSGLQIWLVTTRHFDKVESFFRVQYFSNSAIQQMPHTWRHTGYLDTLKKVRENLANIEYWNGRFNKIHPKFKKATQKLLDNGEMQGFIKHHNRRTRHLPRYIRRYKLEGTKHQFGICRPTPAGLNIYPEKVNVSLFKGEADSIWMEVNATLQKGNEELGIIALNKLEVLTPSSISNELFKHINTLFDNVNATIIYRKRMVSRIRKYFDESHHAFVNLCDNF